VIRGRSGPKARGLAAPPPAPCARPRPSPQMTARDRANRIPLRRRRPPRRSRRAAFRPTRHIQGTDKEWGRDRRGQGRTIYGMTWVIATAPVIFGCMIGDVRVCRRERDGSLVPYETVGLRKLRLFSSRTVCGFAGELGRAWDAVDSLQAYTRDNGQDEPPLLEQLKAWVNQVYRSRDALTQVAPHGVELIVVRTLLDPVTGVVLGSIARVSLPSPSDGKIRVRSSFLMDHIGSGAGISAYQRTIEETRNSLSGLVGMEQAIPGRAVPGVVIARMLSGAIARSPHTTVSPEVDFCVLSRTGALCAASRRRDNPIRVCATLDEFLLWADREDQREGRVPLAFLA